MTRMTSGENKLRRKLFERAPLDYEPELTARDHQILMAIAAYRLLTSAQLTQLFWPPSVAHTLRKWGIDNQQVQALLDQQPAAYLSDLCALLKWLLKVRRIRLAQAMRSTLDKRLQAWLRQMEQDDPQAFDELNGLISTVEQLAPKAWLLWAIQQNLTRPKAYEARPDANRQRISGACTQRLRLLYDAGYLEKIEQATRLSEGRSPGIYLLSKKGRDYLAKLLKKKPQEVYRLELLKISDAKLPHFIKTNDIRIAITLDAERLGFDIIEWRDDLSLQRFHQRPSERVTVEFRGKEVTFGVVPDGYFWLEAGERGQGHFWIECDLNTMVARYSQDGAKDWYRKVIGIKRYYLTRYFDAYPEAEKSLRVLVVTTNQSRLDRLREVTQDAAPNGAHRYWFTTFQRLQSGYPLTDKIWERGDQDGLHAIV